MTCAKLAVQYLDSPEAHQALQYSGNQIEKELRRIEAIICCKDAEEFYKIFESNNQSRYFEIRNLVLSEPTATALKQNPEETIKNYTTFRDATLDLFQSNSRVNTHFTNPHIRQFPKMIMAETEDLLAQLEDCIYDEEAAKTPDILNNNCHALILGIDSAVAAFESNQSRGVIEELISLLSDMSDISQAITTIGSLNSAASNRDASKVAVLTERFQNRAETLEGLVDYILDLIPRSDPERIHIQNKQQQASNSIRTILATASLFEKIQDDSTQALLQSSLLLYSEATSALQKRIVSFEGVFSTSALLDGANDSTSHYGKKMMDALEAKDFEQASANANLASLGLEQLLNIAEKEKDNSEDPSYTEALEIQLASLRIGKLNLKPSCPSMHGFHTGNAWAVRGPAGP